MRKIKFFFLCFILILELISCSSSQKGFVILCAGDSITEQGYPDFLKKLLIKKSIRAKVLNYGLSGHASGEYLRFVKENKNKLEKEYPDFILVQLGTNDVRTDSDETSRDQFYKQMKEMIHIFKNLRTHYGKRPRIFIATIPPIPKNSTYPFSEKSVIRVVHEINPAIHSIAKEEDLCLVDNYSLFRRESCLLPDIHPSKEGYRRLAENWFYALRPFLH